MKTYSVSVTIFILFFLPSCLSSGLLSPYPPSELGYLGDTHHIEIMVVTKNKEGFWTHDYTKTIDDRQQIDSITKTVQNYTERWKHVIGAPGPVTISFRGKENDVIFSLIIDYKNLDEGISYLLTKPSGPSRPMTKFEFEHLMKLLEISEDCAFNANVKCSTE